MKKYSVGLTDDERAGLVELTRRGECKARRLKRAMVLLAADEGKLDREIAGEVRIHEVTIERIRKRFVEEGLECALSEKPRPGKAPKLDGHSEAYLIALACSDPPGGRARWTMRLLADRLVEKGVVDTISDETVRVALKKGAATTGGRGALAARVPANGCLVLPGGRGGIRVPDGGRLGAVRGAVRPGTRSRVPPARVLR